MVFGAARERCKTTLIMVVHEVRKAARELGRRWAAEGLLDHADLVFMLTDDEVRRFRTDAEVLGAAAREREPQYLALWELEPPFIVVLDPPPLSQFTRRDAHVAEQVGVGAVLSGIPGCAGVARGRARVILDPSDPLALEPGDILVAPLTDPAWTPLFVPAAAVVVDVGAQITHAVIVSRELGIPCVVSVTDATRRIPDGALIEVDGAAGTVTVLEAP
jgi:pyruvate,water dikinase